MFTFCMRSLGLLSLVLLPTMSAAKFESVADLIRAEQALKGAAQHIEFSVYANDNNISTFEGKGEIKAVGADINTMKSEFTVAITIKDEDKAPQSLTVWGKIVNKKLYIRAESADEELQAGLFFLGIKKDEWLFVPLDEFVTSFNNGFTEELYNTSGVTIDEAKVQAMMAKIASTVLNMQSSAVKNGYEYTMTLKEHFIKDLLETVKEQLPEYAEEINQNGMSDAEIAIAEGLLAKNLVLKIKVNATTKDEITMNKLYVHYTDDANTVSVDASVKKLLEPLEVYAPSLRSSRQATLFDESNAGTDEDTMSDDLYESDNDSYYNNDNTEVYTNEESQASAVKTYSYEKPSRRQIQLDAELNR